MLRPAHLLDLVRNFTVFQQVDGKTRKVAAHYQQFRAVHKAVSPIRDGRTRSCGAARDERGGIVWHTQGSGKSPSMVFLVRKMRMTPRLNRFKVVVVTDRTDLEGQLRETARLSGEALRPTDHDILRRESPTARTERILAESTPDIVFAMLQKYQEVAARDSGDKVTMTIVRRERKPGRDAHVIQREVTLEVAVVFSGDHNDPESWWDWADKDKQADRIARFKRKLTASSSDKTDPLSILVVNNMLLTGFDAPVEQVLYLDRKIVAHDLLQAIARVNRTSGQKRCGYVVDDIGIARHLNQALQDHDEEDTTGALIDTAVELPTLLDRRARAVAVFTDRGITDLLGQVDVCVEWLEDLRIRADFMNKLRMFCDTLNILEHRPELPGDVFRDAKLLGFINKVAANL